MIVAVDAVGGDVYPQNPIQGALLALQEHDSLKLLFVGPEELITEELKKHDYPKDRVSVYNATQIITMTESPAQAVKSKPDSSISVGLTLHAKGMADAFISAGNTGALLAASAFILGRLKGVMRPTIATIYPTIKGIKLMIDAGANLEVKPEMLVQFAQMGTIYSRDMLGVENPTAGLVNVGEEPEKGTEILKKANSLLQNLPNFIGNVEGRDILKGAADIYVCDGVVGNILLKFGESLPEAISAIVANQIRKAGLSKEQAGMISGLLKDAFAPFDYQHIGGVPFLGVNGISLVGHGGSSPEAMKNMVLNAVRMAEANINEKIVATIN